MQPPPRPSSRAPSRISRSPNSPLSTVSAPPEDDENPSPSQIESSSTSNLANTTPASVPATPTIIQPAPDQQNFGVLYNERRTEDSLADLLEVPFVDMSRHQSSSWGEPARTTPVQLLSAESARNPRRMSQNDKEQLVLSLRTHRVNTITELRRIEKIFAYLDSSEVTEPMTSAWAHYVNSNNLLNELRGLTKNYPFSSECLDEAKALVIRDPNSIRSWNYCWLVLQKIEREQLIMKHARSLAMKPAMWGGKTPAADGVQRLTNACVAEWTRALRQMLRHWDRPPSTTGN